MNHWLPLESNPDVLNEYLEKLGVSADVSFSDVWGLDDEALQFVPRPVHALLLLFPVSAVEKGAAIGVQTTPSANNEEHNTNTNSNNEPLFIKQTIGNACGTIALLHALSNNSDSIDLGSGAMKNLFTKLLPLSPDERAKALETDNDLKRIHESSASAGQTAAPAADEDVDLHFISFVQKNGKVYELDGRKEGPVFHGEAVDGDAFLAVSIAAIRQFIARDPDGNAFTVIALTAKQD